MQLKFLFGLYRVTKSECEEKDALKHCLFMFRKTDVLQHVDVARGFGLIPGNGGFVKHLRSIEKMHFHGESVSCRVATDDSMMKVYQELLKDGSWWVSEYEQYKTKYPIWAVVPKGLKPNLIYCSQQWTPSSHKEMYEIMSAEEKTDYGW